MQNEICNLFENGVKSFMARLECTLRNRSNGEKFNDADRIDFAKKRI